MLGQIGDALGQNRNLNFRRAGIVLLWSRIQRSYFLFAFRRNSIGHRFLKLKNTERAKFAFGDFGQCHGIVPFVRVSENGLASASPHPRRTFPFFQPGEEILRGSGMGLPPRRRDLYRRPGRRCSQRRDAVQRVAIRGGLNTQKAWTMRAKGGRVSSAMASFSANSCQALPAGRRHMSKTAQRCKAMIPYPGNGRKVLATKRIF